MPSVINHQANEVEQARLHLRRYLSVKGNTETALGKLSGAPQYAISRFVGGRTKSITNDVQNALNASGFYASVGIADQDLALDSPRFRRALASAWDGTAGGLDLLIAVIEAVGPVLRSVEHRA